MTHHGYTPGWSSCGVGRLTTTRWHEVTCRRCLQRRETHGLGDMPTGPPKIYRRRS